MKRTRQEKIRLGVVFVIVTGFFLLATARLVHLQVFLSSEYAAIVDAQATGQVEIPAERGAIYDRSGQLVARNVISSSIYVYPRDRHELAEVARYFDKTFGYPSGTSKKEFRIRPGKFSWVKRHVPDEFAAKVEREAPRGVYLREESRRAYPFGEIGKQILGFTNIDNKGQAGFEYAFDSLLTGKSGKADIRRDGLSRIYKVKETALVKPVPGTSVVLTIDWALQDIVENELDKAVHEYNGKSGMAVFLDCRNGDILAMAHYDINEGSTNKPTKLRAITDQFEPGSVFKAFTAAALLDAGIVDFSDSVYCEDGRWKIGRRYLHDDKKHEWLNFRQVMELSSNIGIAKYALKLDADDLVETYRRFGFGEKLRCGLPGETAGQLEAPSRWSDYNVAALAMGHSVAVNALQLAAAFGAIANDGVLLRPRLQLGYVDNDGYVVSDGKPDAFGRAMKSSSVDSLKAFLRGVVEHGTAETVNSEVVTIAGKTGTAEIPNLKTGGYYKNRFTASFAGFFPYENPVVAGVVVIVDPRPITYGGWTAGPAFRRIAERYTVLNPDLFAAPGRMLAEKSERLDNTVSAPDLVGRDINLAVSMARERGVELCSTAKEGKVAWQFPPADRLMFAGDKVLVAVETPADGDLCMADLTGLSMRTVAAFLHHAGIKYTIQGCGRVISQSIKPGTRITQNQEPCRLTCRQT